MHMMSVLDLMGNEVHLRVLPDVHDGICSTPVFIYSTPSEAPDAHYGYCRLGRKCGVHPSVLPDVHDGICSTPVGIYSTPSEAPDAHDGYCRLGRKYGVHPSVLPDVHA